MQSLPFGHEEKAIEIEEDNVISVEIVSPVCNLRQGKPVGQALSFMRGRMPIMARL
jgi:hypothetical protein